MERAAETLILHVISLSPCENDCEWAANNLSHTCLWIQAVQRQHVVFVWIWAYVLMCVNEHSCFELTVISWPWPRISSCCWISRSRLSCPLLSFISCRALSPGCESQSYFQAMFEPRLWNTTDKFSQRANDSSSHMWISGLECIALTSTTFKETICTTNNKCLKAATSRK